METKESQQLKHLFEIYFKNRGVRSITPINNTNSIADGTIVSGASDTTILVECKKRNESITRYNSTLIERKKHDSLVQVMKLLDIPFYLYIVEWDECYTIYSLSEKSYNLTWEQMPCPTSTVGNDEIKLKEVAFLKYSDSTIISKKHKEERPYSDLKFYIDVVRAEYNGR